MKNYVGFQREQLGTVFELVGRLADAIVATIGAHCEVVVHDLRDTSRSVVKIAGNLTDRHVGSPIPDPEFLPERLAEYTADQQGYTTRTRSGRNLYSSTVWIRDDSQRIVGAVCVNVDHNDLHHAHELLTRLLGDTCRGREAPAPVESPLLTFAADIEQFVAIALQDVVQRTGRQLHQLTRDDRVAAIRELERMGGFNLRGVTEVVATQLGVSRASVFNYLQEVRRDLDDVAPPARS